MENPDSVEARMRALYGTALGPARGVLHVVAVARVQGALRVMRIGEHAPKSASDYFALELTRARVDAIVVSGSVLRAEPELRYDLPAEFSRVRAGRPAPYLCVLTRSGDLPAEHPVWQSEARPIVYTGADAALDLPARVEVVRDETPTPRRAIEHLRQARGCAAVSIEAGPRVAVPLYDEPLLIDELLLSVFEGALDERAIGGAFLEPAQMRARLEWSAGPTRVPEPSGPWTFSRYVRRAAPGD